MIKQLTIIVFLFSLISLKANEADVELIEVFDDKPETTLKIQEPLEIDKKLVLSDKNTTQLVDENNKTTSLAYNNNNSIEMKINILKDDVKPVKLKKDEDLDFFMYGDFVKIIRFDMIFVKQGYSSSIDKIYNKVQKYLDKNQEVSLEITGYTRLADKDEYMEHIKEKDFYIYKLQEMFAKHFSEKKSVEVSEKYALEVKNALEKKGIQESIIKVQYKGANDNYFSNVTEQGQNLNNRVAVVLYVYKPKKKVIDKTKIDSDSDGVYDQNDSCPETPEGLEVNESGCPLDEDNDGVFDISDDCPNTQEGLDVDISGCPFDEDNDGVYDYQDKCLHTLLDVEVEENGCPYDMDKDGVYDYKDDCPATKEGLTVNDVGCAISKTLKLHFKRYASNIPEKSINEVREFAKFLKENPKYTIEIIGHTDSRDNAMRNMLLSEKRAKSTKKALVKFGVESSRISCVGMGELEPIATNETVEGRQANRRIEIKLIY